MQTGKCLLKEGMEKIELCRRGDGWPVTIQKNTPYTFEKRVPWEVIIFTQDGDITLGLVLFSHFFKETCDSTTHDVKVFAEVAASKEEGELRKAIEIIHEQASLIREWSDWLAVYTGGSDLQARIKSSLNKSTSFVLDHNPDQEGGGK